MDIYPIAVTTVDWPSYLQLAQQSTGHSASGTIDQYKMKHDAAGFIVSLSEILFQGRVDPAKAIREAGALLRHCTVTFLAVMTTDILGELREELDLAITSSDSVQPGIKVAVLTGNFLQWREAVVNLCSERLSTTARQLGNKIMAYFESGGLTGIWSGYSKTSMPDRTIKLIEK